MPTNILEVLAPRLPSDAAEARLVKRLNTTHIILLAAFVLAMVINEDIITRAASGLMAGLVLGLILLMRSAHIQLPRALTPVCVYFYISVMIFNGFGVYSSSVAALGGVVVLAALFGSRLSMLIYLCLCIITLIAAFFLEGMGYIDNGRNGIASTLTDLANVCLILLGLGGILWVLIGGMEEDRDEAWQISRSLERSSERLMEETAIRLKTESTYRLLAENASDFIWTLDMGLNYTYCSPSCLSFTGRSAEELVGQPASAMIIPEDVQRMNEVWAFESREELKFPGSRQPQIFELRLQKEDGSIRWIESSMAFLREDGRPIGIVGSSRDIDDRIRMEVKQKDVANQLRQSQKMDSIGQLAGAVAHDFNNLLLAIQGYAELIRHTQDKKSIDEFAGELITASHRAANLTKQLLTFSRQHSMETQPVELLELTRSLVSMLTRLMPEDVELDIATDAGEFMVQGDHGQLEQVITNLCVNARDAIEGAGSISIRLERHFLREDPQLAEGGYIRLAVTDTGTGMSDELKERVFDPFFTTKEVGKGTGLGLSVVHGIIAEHGGTINISSALGSGTTVTILLPQLHEAGTSADVPMPDTISFNNAGRGQTVLVVEDEALVRKVVTKILIRAGYEVIEATDAEMGEEMFRQRQAELGLLLCDAVMPGRTGINLVKLVRQIDPDLPIIMMSGYKSIDPLEGVSEVSLISKPFSANELLDLVQQHLVGS